LPAHLLREFEHFFSVYKDLEDLKTASLGWKGAAEAMAVLEAAGAAMDGES
jgi:inorganic pyrophosphatase